MTIYTDKAKQWLAHEADSLTSIMFNEQTIEINTLPTDVQHSIIILNEWQTNLRSLEMNRMQLQHAIESLKRDISSRLTAVLAEPSPEDQPAPETQSDT